MNLKLLYYKIFKKDKLVRTIYFDDAKRVRILYAIPDKKAIVLFNGKSRHEITQEDFFMMDGIPTYVHRAGRIEPINPFATKDSIMDEEYYNTAVNSELAKDVFKKTEEDENKNVIMVVMGIGLLLIVLGGFIYIQFETVIEMLEQIHNSGVGGGR